MAKVRTVKQEIIPDPVVQEAEAAAEAAAREDNPSVKNLREGYKQVIIGRIFPHPDNPRKHFDADKLQELAESIKACGIVQPIVVVERAVKTGSATEVRYQLVAGERRWRAAKLAGLETVPAVVRDLTEQQVMEVMLLENLQREDLNAIEEAKAYGRLIAESGWTQEELGGKIGKSQGYIANRLRLLDLPEEVQENISRGILSPSQGRALLKYVRWPKLCLGMAKLACSACAGSDCMPQTVTGE